MALSLSVPVSWVAGGVPLPVATALGTLGTRRAPAGALGAGGSTAVLRIERLVASGLRAVPLTAAGTGSRCWVGSGSGAAVRAAVFQRGAQAAQVGALDAVDELLE